MDDGQNDKKVVRRLKVVLVIILLIIVALVVGIIIVNNNRPVGDPDFVEIPDYSNTPEYKRIYENFEDNFSRVNSKAKDLLSQNPPDVASVIQMYKNRMDECNAGGVFQLVLHYANAEKEVLVAAGFKREALDALIAVDFSNLLEAEQYRIYRDIIALAKELGDDKVVEKYEPLAAKVKKYDDSEAKASEEALERYEAKIKEINERNDEK